MFKYIQKYLKNTKPMILIREFIKFYKNYICQANLIKIFLIKTIKYSMENPINGFETWKKMQVRKDTRWKTDNYFLSID